MALCRRRTRLLATFSQVPRRTCRSAFAKKPDHIKDYYTLIPKEQVITLPTFTRRVYATRQAFLADVEQLFSNAEIYNKGREGPNPGWTGPGCGVPQILKVGPGMMAHPGVAQLAWHFRDRVQTYLQEHAAQVRALCPPCAHDLQPGALCVTA